MVRFYLKFIQYKNKDIDKLTSPELGKCFCLVRYKPKSLTTRGHFITPISFRFFCFIKYSLCEWFKKKMKSCECVYFTSKEHKLFNSY